MKHYDRVYAKIDLDAIIQNVKNMKQNLQEQTQIIGVIKTDGYGHGAIPIAKELEKLPDIAGFATATIEEALLLRRSGTKKPILILGHTFSYSYEDLVVEELRPAVFRIDMVRELSKIAVQLKKTIAVHVKVDTGMNRIGITPDKDGLAFVKEVGSLPGIEVEGIFTHFARSDESDKTSANKQLLRFLEFVKEAETELQYKIPIKHSSNSAALVELPDANMNWVRAGITLYGLWPSEEVTKDKVFLTPVLSLLSQVIMVKTVDKDQPVSYGGTFVTTRTTKIATIPVGYGDGYPRSLSSKGYVLIRGEKAPIIGRICMDQFMVDVTDIPDVKEGDLVTLIGQDGGERITMEELGELSGRFNYELACDLGKRIPRIFYKHNQVVATQDYF